MLSSFTSYFIRANEDKRVDSWFLMANIYPTLILCSIYVLCVLIIGPKFMKNRKAYDIKNLMLFYNVIQVIMSAWLFQGLAKSGWFIGGYNWICQDVDRNPDVNSRGYQMAQWIYLCYLSRFVDFVDTFFFIARKKFDHVSKLQVLHHFLTPIYAWIIVRYTPGGNDTLGALINYLVHTLMYFYYFLAALGPQYKKFLWWKRYMTTFQIIQFVTIFIKTLFISFGFIECGFPWQISLITQFMFALMLMLFGEFYVNTYMKKGKNKST